MTESLALSHIRPQGGFLAEKRGQWQAGLFGDQNVDDPSVAIVVAGQGGFLAEKRGQWQAGLFGDQNVDDPSVAIVVAGAEFCDLSLRDEQHKRILAKAMEKQQQGRLRRREQHSHVTLHDDRESAKRVYGREGHYVAVPPPDRLLRGSVGSRVLPDGRTWALRVVQDVSLPSPYSCEEREPSEVETVDNFGGHQPLMRRRPNSWSRAVPRSRQL